MKRMMVAIVVLGLTQSGVQAEPVFMVQAASVLKKAQAEVGIGAQSGYQKYEIRSSAGTRYVNRVWQFPLSARYGVTDTIETHLIIPITRAVDSAEGLVSSRDSATGLGNVQLGTQWNFTPAPVPMAVGLDLDLPTVNTKNNEASLGQRYSAQVQQGFNGHVYVAGDVPLLAERLAGHLSLGYMNTATYTTASRSRFNPSDLFTFGASLDLNANSWVRGLTASAEMVGNSALNHSKTHGVANGNDKGTILEVGPALRWQHGSWKTHAGILFDQGKATFRAYTFRTAFGISYLFGESH